MTSTSATAEPSGFPEDQIAARITNFLANRLGVSIGVDEDIYDRGLVTSMFAMELVVQLEKAFNIEIIGPDLQLANFRSTAKMTSLVLRLLHDA